MNLLIHHRTAKIICLIGFFLGTGLLIHKYYSLGYYDWDFAFFSQAMWSLGHGSGYVSLFGVNFFSNHANLIALILLPLYKIFSHPVTLLVLKMLSFSIASYVLYLLAAEKLGQNIGLLVLCLYWLFPANIYGLVYEFDFENLAPPFIMLVFYYYSKERWLPFIISSIFLISIKENMPLIILAFGIHGLFTKSDKILWGLIPMVLGAFSFYILAFIFVPLMGGHAWGQHPYAAHYSNLKLSHPLETMQSIFTTKKLNWLKHLLGPLSLSIFSPGTLFLGSPIILQHFLSNGWQEQTIYFGYMLTVVPFIFLAFIDALDWIKKKISRGKFYLILFISTTFSVIYFLGQINHLKSRYMDLNSPAISTYGWPLLKMVPSQAPVVASFGFLPELSQRPYVYSFHKIYDPLYQNKEHTYKLPENVHYALIDFNDTWLLWRLQKPSAKSEMRDFFTKGRWKIKHAYGGVVLFER